MKSEAQIKYEILKLSQTQKCMMIKLAPFDKSYPVFSDKFLVEIGGNKEGVSDLFFALPLNGLNGLWIKIKNQEGILTYSELRWIFEMVRFGYSATVVYSAEEGIDIMQKYIDGKMVNLQLEELLMQRGIRG